MAAVRSRYYAVTALAMSALPRLRGRFLPRVFLIGEPPVERMTADGAKRSFSNSYRQKNLRGVPYPPAYDWLRMALASQKSSINGDDRSSCVAGRRHTQERHCPGNIIRLPPALERGPFGDAVVMRLVLSSGLVDAGLDITRRDRVDPDTLRRPGKRQGLGQHHDAALAGAISGNARQRERSVHRSDVDDRTFGLCQRGAEGHACPERAGKVHVEHFHEGRNFIFLVARQDARTIDERIDTLMLFRESIDGRIIGDIERSNCDSGPRTKLRARDRGFIDGSCGDGCAQITEQIRDRAPLIARP